MADRKRPELSPIVLVDSNGKDVSQSPGQYLTVDETKRPRANSDPVGLHFALSILPEITVTAEDMDDDDGDDDDDEVDTFLVPPSPRPRANTCPEDMFLQRKERPPTPPPTDIAKIPATGRKINRFNFTHNTKDMNSVSFIHHKLSKVSEDGSCGIPNRQTSHRRHSTGRRASCLAALSESSSLLEEENEQEVLASPSPVALSHSMNSLSLSSSSAVSDGNSPENNKPCQVLMKCSVGVDKADVDSNRRVMTSHFSIR